CPSAFVVRWRPDSRARSTAWSGHARRSRTTSSSAPASHPTTCASAGSETATSSSSGRRLRSGSRRTSRRFASSMGSTNEPGTCDVTREELGNGLFQGLRLLAVGLAFAVYALRVDHDRLLSGAGWARRSSVAVALATRLLPLLERDARDLRVALRGRHAELGPVRQLSPLLAGSLERGLNVAEAMEARGYGRPGRTRAPQPG